MECYLAPLPIPVFIHDHTVDIGLPEHLQAVERQLEIEAPHDPSFSSLLMGIKKTVEIAGGSLTELRSEAPFSVSVSEKDVLSITFGDCSVIVEVEQLRGVWTSLLSGMVTQGRVGRYVHEGAGPLLSLLSLLPQIRPLEIHYLKADVPEIAVELKAAYRQSSVSLT